MPRPSLVPSFRASSAPEAELIPAAAVGRLRALVGPAVARARDVLQQGQALLRSQSVEVQGLALSLLRPASRGAQGPNRGLQLAGLGDDFQLLRRNEVLEGFVLDACTSVAQQRDAGEVFVALAASALTEAEQAAILRRLSVVVPRRASEHVAPLSVVWNEPADHAGLVDAYTGAAIGEFEAQQIGNVLQQLGIRCLSTGDHAPAYYGNYSGRLLALCQSPNVLGACTSLLAIAGRLKHYETQSVQRDADGVAVLEILLRATPVQIDLLVQHLDAGQSYRSLLATVTHLQSRSDAENVAIWNMLAPHNIRLNSKTGAYRDPETVAAALRDNAPYKDIGWAKASPMPDDFS